METPDTLPVRAYAGLTTVGSSFQSFALLICRLAWGWKMYLSGYRHLGHFSQTVETFKNDFHVPFPALSVSISGTTELVGGILLMIGLATRVISIPLVFNFVVAILTAGAMSVKQFVNGGQFVKDYSPGRLSGLEAIIDDTAFPFLMISLVLFAFGPGKVSIDYLIWKTFIRKPAGLAPPGFPIGPSGR